MRLRVYRRPLWTLLAAFGLSSILLLSGCASTTRAGSVEADRSQLLLTDSAALNKEAEKLYRQELAEAKKQNALNNNPAMVARVKHIVDRLAPQTGVFRPDAPAWAWEANVVKSDDVNAYCYPGGKIIVLTGIITKLKLTDDELAAILGHEIAHALREHTREQQSQSVVANVFTSAASTYIGGFANLIGHGVMLSNSRTAETEADRIGVELMARAGYDPNGAVSLWKKMMAESGGGGNNPIAQFLSTHPADEDRIRTVSKDAQTVYPLYQEAAKAHATPTKKSATSASKPTAAKSGRAASARK